jgi:hypothetical protein
LQMQVAAVVLVILVLLARAHQPWPASTPALGSSRYRPLPYKIQ